MAHAANGGMGDGVRSPGAPSLSTPVCIIGSGPAAHTAAIYAARAQMWPILFEGMMANGVAAGGQLTTTTSVENFPGFPGGIGGYELCQRFRDQSEEQGTRIFTETVVKVDLRSRPFQVWSDERHVQAATLIIATGAVARRLHFPGAGEGEGGFWNRGISACAVCDGALPMFRNKPLAVVGGGDTALEEALFLTHYASRVYVIHRRDELRASKVMQKRALENRGIEFVWSHTVVEAHGEKLLNAITLQSTKTGERQRMEVAGLFFAIGHDPATAFLEGQVALDEQNYIITKAGSAQTSVEGVFAAGDVQDKQYRQAITAAGTGCMAALEAERWLAAHTDELTAVTQSWEGVTAMPTNS